MKKHIAVLISGNGSNLRALINATAHADFPAHIALVISNKADAYGLKRAEAAGIPTIVIQHKDFTSREAFDARLQEALLAHQIQIVCLAGFMRLLSPGFVKLWEGRMLNIHPSLLPAFKGLDAIGQAWKAGVKETGCTVHLVTEEMDSGEILLQEKVTILPGDTYETLAQRIHAAEHRIYPEALKLLLSPPLEGGD